MRVLARIHAPNGGVWNASNNRWLAFPAEDGDNTGGPSSEWTMYLWDRQSHKLKVVGHSPVDAHGNPLPYYFIEPVLSDRYLYWIQATRNNYPLAGGAVGTEIVQYNLTTAHKRMLYNGVVGAVMPQGQHVLFTAVRAVTHQGPALTSQGKAKWDLRAVDEDSGKAVRAPTGLTAAGDGAFQMLTNGDAVVWDRPQGGIAVWRPEWGKTINVLPDMPTGNLADVSGIDRLGFYKQFLIFRAGNAWVLDLRTDTIAALTPSNGWPSFGGGHFVTVTAFIGVSGGYTASMLDLAKLPDLPGCRAK